MITKYDLLKHIEDETLRRIERNLQYSYREIREIILDLHRQINALAGIFETNQEIYERYIESNEKIQKINTYSKIKDNVYWDAIAYNNICKKRLGIDNLNSLTEREFFRQKIKSDSLKVRNEFESKCRISADELESVREVLVSRLNDFTQY